MVGEEDEGAVDGDSLGGMAGERVAVVEMLGGVGEGDVPVDAALIADDEASVVQVDDAAAHAVAEAEPAVVSAAEDLIADAVLALAERDGFPAEPAVAEHQRVRGLVEFVDVCTAVGEHHVAGGSAPCFPPPVVE